VDLLAIEKTYQDWQGRLQIDQRISIFYPLNVIHRSESWVVGFSNLKLCSLSLWILFTCLLLTIFDNG